MGNQVSFEDIKELFRESRRDFDQRSAEYDKRAAETDRKMRETDRKIADLGRQIGGLGNRLGEFFEGVVRPGLVRMFRRWGLFVIGQRGEDAVLLNSEDFEPRAW